MTSETDQLACGHPIEMYRDGVEWIRDDFQMEVWHRGERLSDPYCLICRAIASVEPATEPTRPATPPLVDAPSEPKS